LQLSGHTMTCEVAVMNKYAIVIAADSAVTTTDSNGLERYSKGGNKIFQLSNDQPVGVMIFGSAMLDGMPWEIIIKAYRASAAGTSYATLAEYCAAFFTFVKNASHLFSATDRDKNYRDCLNAAARKLLGRGRSDRPVIDDATKSVAERKAAWEQFLTDQNAELNGLPLHAEISPADFQKAMQSIVNFIPTDVATYLQSEGLNNVIDPANWFSCACLFFFKCHDSILSATGIVFSGFGVDQYFPEVVAYDVQGFVRDSFVFSKQQENSCQIGHDQPSAIFQFAMTSSIVAFTTGLDVGVFSEVQNAYETELTKFGRSLLMAANAQIPTNFDAQVASSRDAFCKDWVPKVYDLHYHPMKRVIASLPIEEMTHLAETLVVLQSLKERVTSPRQSVGGPIDVAVITKSEGLVWIKRKQYFDQDKNLRYVLRQHWSKP
jgi:hypothetical protein